jgi:hypothetical protein
MTGRRLAVVTLAALGAAVTAGGARAQPKDPDDEIEIEVEPEPTTPGSATAGRPATEAGDPAAPVAVKDPKLAKKWLAAAGLLMQKASRFAAKARPIDARAQFENAITAYQRAIEASDDVALYAELATAEEKIGKLDDAVKHLLRVITAPAGVKPELARRASVRLETLSTRVGFVTVTVTPPGSSISLGGTPIGPAPLAEPLVLMPGTYTLAFQADGFQPKEAEIKVDPGVEIERAIELDPVNVRVEPPRPLVPDEPLPGDRPTPRSRAPLYAGAAITGAAVVGSAVFGILALGEHATFVGAATAASDREDARVRGQQDVLIAGISLGTAVVAAGVTVAWYFVKYRQPHRKSDNRPRPPAAAKLDVVPWVQPQSGGVTLAGRF